MYLHVYERSMNTQRFHVMSFGENKRAVNNLEDDVSRDSHMDIEIKR